MTSGIQEYIYHGRSMTRAEFTKALGIDDSDEAIEAHIRANETFTSDDYVRKASKPWPVTFRPDGSCDLDEVLRLADECDDTGQYESCPNMSDEVRWLVAEIRRLRGVIALGERRNQHCDWCDAFRKPSAADKEPHAVDCPAFSPDGTVK